MENQNDQTLIDYSFKELNILKITFLGFIFFIAGFFIYFPIGEKTNDILRKALSGIPGCAINFDQINFEMFAPKVVMKNAKIPMSCLGQFGEPISLSELKVNFHGPAFSPFGLKFRIDANIKQTPLQIHLVQGLFGAQVIRLDKNKVNLELLKLVIPQVELQGNVVADAYARISKGNVEEMKLTLNSQDISAPAQSINAFRLPNLNLNLLSLKAQIVKANELEVIDFFLGDTNAPIRSNFKGKINLNPGNMNMSNLNLKGEVAFSESFLNSFMIIKMFMDQYTKRDQFYQLEITGPMQSPKIASPNKNE